MITIYSPLNEDVYEYYELVSFIYCNVIFLLIKKKCLAIKLNRDSDFSGIYEEKDKDDKSDF